MGRIEDTLAPLMADGDPQALRRSARVLWAGIHGITSLSTADKLSIISADTVGPLVDDLVGFYLKGLSLQHGRQLAGG